MITSNIITKGNESQILFIERQRENENNTANFIIIKYEYVTFYGQKDTMYSGAHYD